MEFLTQLFGPPHEMLHVIALRLIGRKAISTSRTHVDIPDDLTVGQYVFVAGLPAIVFWGLAIVGVLLLVFAPNIPALMLGFVLLLVGGLGGAGTLGDLALIYERLNEPDDQ